MQPIAGSKVPDLTNSNYPTFFLFFVVARLSSMEIRDLFEEAGVFALFP